MLKYNSLPLEVQYAEDGTTLTFTRPNDAEILAFNRFRYVGLPTKTEADGTHTIDFSKITHEQSERLYSSQFFFMASRLIRIENLLDGQGNPIESSAMSGSAKADFIADLDSSSPLFHDFAQKYFESKKKA
jgi:hypothetical protein